MISAGDFRNGMTFEMETAPDPTTDVGVPGAQQYITDHVPEWVKKYGEKTVIENLNAEIPDRGITGIFGPSGSGKTTLLRIICGLDSPDSGRVTGTEDVRFSLVFQEDRLLESCTALKNVDIVSDREKAEYWLGKTGLGDSFDKYPSQLSGGMRRRVALARAFAFDGDILVLDEPFNGIEEETKKQIEEIVVSF